VETVGSEVFVAVVGRYAFNSYTRNPTLNLPASYVTIGVSSTARERLGFICLKPTLDHDFGWGRRCPTEKVSPPLPGDVALWPAVHVT
jgi:hypothetical protein